MKLASLKHGRDGQLLVVSRDLARATDASHVVPTLQAALDDWDAAAPRLQEMPESFWSDPLMYQGGSDALLGPTDPIEVVDEAYGIDFEAEVAVILGDVAMAAGREQAARAIRLIVLVNDVSLRNLIAAELAKGFGFFNAKPSSAFSPVAVTPDELGHAFDGAKVALPLLSHVNGAPFGKPNAGADMTFDFPTLIAHAAKTRPLSAGTIVGSGTVSNKDAGGPGRPVAEGGLGS